VRSTGIHCPHGFNERRWGCRVPGSDHRRLLGPRGGIAYFSGFNAAQALAQNAPAHFVAQRINEGVGEGFEITAPLSIIALIIVVWS
jgi:hypothetical protein